MKSIFKVFTALVIVFTFLASDVSAQTMMGAPFQKGDKIGQLGIGFGFYGTYGSAGMPPISAGFQYGIEDKISIGGIMAYTTSTEDFGFNDSYSWKYSYFLIGARGEYHFLEDVENLDGYAGLTLGYTVVSVTEPSGVLGNFSASGSYAFFGFHGGVRYYFNPRFAVFGEVGFGLGFITAGVAYKF